MRVLSEKKRNENIYHQPRVSRRGANLTSLRRRLSTTVIITVVETTRRGGHYT